MSARSSQQQQQVADDDACNSSKQQQQQQLRQKYQGTELFEKIATKAIQDKELARSNRCPQCWHDRTLRCICPLILPLKRTTLLLPTIQVLILMHYKEYLSAGDDAKLLLRILPPNQNSKLFVFGREGDWELFENECAIDPVHTLTLWPSSDGALTIQEYLNRLPDESPWKQQQQERAKMPAAATNRSEPEESSPASSSSLPVLRVIVLDGVYTHARNMFKTMKKRLLVRQPPHIALHPDTLSVYHRAQKTYAMAQSTSQQNLNDESPNDTPPLRICTVEAYALLLKELGESPFVTDALVQAVRINNDALVHSIHVRPKSGMPTSSTSGAAKRRKSRRKNRKQQQQ